MAVRKMIDTPSDASARSLSELNNSWIPLVPFEHQVGGITRVFSVNHSLICKPCVQRELIFYKTMPSSLIEFTPCLAGLLDVHVQFNKSGECVALGRPLECDLSLLPLKLSRRTSDNKDTREPALCLRQNLSKYKRSYSTELKCMANVREQVGFLAYVAFDNILNGFDSPSVLDLKVGLRLYGDDHDKDVVGWKVAKYKKTTSTSLGLRQCGMKVYNRVTDSYTVWNKYESFNYTTDQLYHSLLTFLHDGISIRYNVIAQFLDKLCSLRDVVSNLPTFRFYSVSLLLVYDSFSTCSPNCKPRTVFNCRYNQHGQHKATTNINPACDRDSKQPGCSCHEEDANHQADICQYSQHVNPVSSNGNISSTIFANSLTHPSLLNHISSADREGNLKSSECCCNPKVDVRLIDFAHSTHANFPGDHVKHQGPHRGFLFGLNSLIGILRSIQKGSLF